MQSTVAARARHRRVSGFPGDQLAVLFCLLMLLISVPIWTHQVPPLSDYANHLARMHAIAKLSTDPTLAQYYQVNWQIIPEPDHGSDRAAARPLHAHLSGRAALHRLHASS